MGCAIKTRYKKHAWHIYLCSNWASQQFLNTTLNEDNDFSDITVLAKTTGYIDCLVKEAIEI
jgi:hypothetical protein